MHIDRSKLVGVIDEGTNVAQFIVKFHNKLVIFYLTIVVITLQIYKIPEFEEVASHHMEVSQITPKDGWVEQNPVEILETVRLCAKHACDKLSALGIFN